MNWYATPPRWKVGPRSSFLYLASKQQLVNNAYIVATLFPMSRPFASPIYVAGVNRPEVGAAAFADASGQPAGSAPLSAGEASGLLPRSY